MVESKDMENNELGTSSRSLELREVAYAPVQQAGLARVSSGISDFLVNQYLLCVSHSSPLKT